MSQTIKLNGRSYAVDYGSESYRRQSIPLLRRQSDQGDRPGSQSLNPEGPWRRTQESWHRGEGQTHLDRLASDPARFNESSGVDVWDRYALRLLPKTMKVYTPDVSIVHTLVVGNRLYVADGSNVKFTTDLNTWTTVTGLVASPNRLASDGQTVWIATGGTLYSMDNAGTAAAAYGSSLAADVWYVKGRLLTTSSNGRTLQNVLNTVDAPTVLATLPTGKWVDATEGNGFIYVTSTTQATASLRGTGEGTVHRIAIKADGTGLDVPVVAAKLPSGEDVYSIFGYLGYIMIGTSGGVRFAAENSDGSLTLGALRSVQNIGSGQGVRGFTAEGRFVYCTQSAVGFDAPNAGLSRFDLSEFIAPLTPAAAADLTTPAGTIASQSSPDVTSCGTRSGSQYFAVSGSGPGSPGGIYSTESAVVASGSISTGAIDYGISEPKLPLYIDVQTEPLQNGTSVLVDLKIDGALNFTNVGTHNVIGASSYTADISGQVIDPETNAVRACRFFEVRLRLQNTLDSSATPVVTRVTLRTYPVTDRGEIIQLPLLLGEQVEHDGQVVNLDVSAELQTIRDLLSTKQLVPLVEGDTTTQVYLEDFVFAADGRDEDGTDLRGTLVVKLKSFA